MPVNDYQEKDPRTYAIIGAAMQVHRELGCGFLEGVYQEAVAVEFAIQLIPARREVSLPVYYRDKPLDVSYRADFVCFESVIVELKALPKITGLEEAQLLNYLRATNVEVGLILNFGATSLEWKRLVRTPRAIDSRTSKPMNKDAQSTTKLFACPSENLRNL